MSRANMSAVGNGGRSSQSLAACGMYPHGGNARTISSFVFDLWYRRLDVYGILDEGLYHHRSAAHLAVNASNYSARARKQKFKLPWSYNPAQSMELA